MKAHFQSVRGVEKVSYKLLLLANIKAHLVFHASQLKPYVGDKKVPSREEFRRPMMSIRETHEMEAQAILSDKVVRRDSQPPIREL